jgi:hypothetical protein
MVLGVDRPLQGLNDLAEVLPHRRLAGVRIAGRQRLDDGFVLAQRACPPPRPQDRPVLKADALGLEIGEQPAGRPVVGDRPDPLMKLGVELRVPHRIALRQPLAHPDDRAAKIPEISGGNPLGGVANDQLFEDNPDLLDLERLAIGDEAHPGSPVQLAADQSFLIEPDERSTDRGPAGVEPEREVSFHQPLVRMKAAADDRIPKAPVGVGAAVLDGLGSRTLGSCGRRTPRRVGDGSFQ